MFTSAALALSLLAVVSAAPRFPNIVNNAQLSAEWDYIVAGGGPSGIIVAERLVEKNYNVLLLEAGGPSTASTGGDAAPTWNATGLTIYDIASQDGALFTTGATNFCTDTGGLAACLLGGGVEVNALVFVPPADHDFDDRWPEGWKWADIEGSLSRPF
jgi:cellobiose dehydrogenase (acceptor)